MSSPAATNPQLFALRWVEAWNKKDLEAIMSHYAEGVQFTSPRVATTPKGDPSGRLVGKQALAAYFQEALHKLDNLRLDLQDVLVGVDGSMCVMYTRETGAKVAEVLHLDSSGKAASVACYYDLVC